MPSQALDKLGAPARIPACGPPRSLSPEKHTRSAPAARLAAAVGSSPMSTSAPEPRSSTRGSPAPLATRRAPRVGLLGEPDDAEVGLVHAQEQRRLRADRALVVGGARAVGRADLDEPRSRAGQHLGNPEAVTDLDQLAARDEHVAALGERGEREQHRGGVVVDDQRCLGTGEPAQQAGEMVLPRAAGAGLEVVLEIRVAAADLGDAGEADGASGARPRFVWTSTPVALSTRRSEGARAAASSASVASTSRRDRVRRGSRRARASSAARDGRRARAPAAQPASRASASTRSTDGRSRRRGHPLECRQTRAPELTSARAGSRQERCQRAWARAPTSSTCSCVDRLGQDAGRHVRHAREREAADAHVPRGEHLGHGRHPDEIGAERRGSSGSRPASRRPGRATPRRRPRRASTPSRARGCLGGRSQRGVVGVAHVGKPGPSASSFGPTSGEVPWRFR